MQLDFTRLISKKLSLDESCVSHTIKLLSEGATIPFISRYRKEFTGGLDEVQVASVKELLEKLTELSKRKETILKSLESQDKLTVELKERIESCWDSTTLEDIYLPYKPKRRTRAEIARQKGLEPLALQIFKQKEGIVAVWANRYLSQDVKTVDDAVAGAKDIIAEIG